MREREWLSRAGGPFLLLETRLLAHWHGADATLPNQPSDYDRACRTVQQPSRCVLPLPVGDGVGLVFGDDPGDAYWLPTGRLSGLLVKCTAGGSNESILEAVDRWRRGKWTGTQRPVHGETEFEAGGSLLLFDSAYSGDDVLAGRTEALSFDLARAAYTVKSVYLESVEEFLYVHAIEGREQADPVA